MLGVEAHAGHCRMANLLQYVRVVHTGASCNMCFVETLSPPCRLALRVAEPARAYHNIPVAGGSKARGKGWEVSRPDIQNLVLRRKVSEKNAW